MRIAGAALDRRTPHGEDPPTNDQDGIALDVTSTGVPARATESMTSFAPAPVRLSGLGAFSKRCVDRWSAPQRSS